jgi:uncharacterized protein YbjT (DUF2867 family)
MTGAGLLAVLDGADAVVDVATRATTSARVSVEFFGTATTRLLDAERELGIGHHVALSIIGAREAPHAYYAGKARQEELVEASPVPWSMLRATQFHEFAGQIAGQGRLGPIIAVPAMRSEPVAAREVGALLAEIATGAPRGWDRDLAGPREESMPDMVRRYAAATGLAGRVVGFPLPGAWGRALRDGTLLGGPDARRGTITFDAWLAAGAR